MRESSEELLVRVCRRDAVERTALADLRSLEDPSVARALLERSAIHGVRALVLLRLQEVASRESVDPPWLGAFLEPLARLRKQSDLRDFELDRILSALKASAIRAVVLKGGALRHVAYSRPVERWMGDLDLLVAPADTTRALSMLSALGYSSDYSEAAYNAMGVHHYHYLVTHPAGFIVEVHQGLTRPGEPCRLDPATFLERAREVRLPSGQAMLAPSNEDMLLHLVSQVEQEGCRRLSRFVDLDRLVVSGGTLDWEEVGRRAEAGNLGVSLAVSLRLANVLLSTPVPVWALEGQRISRASRWGIESTRPVSHLLGGHRIAPVVADDLIRFWLLPSWEDRVARLRSLASIRGDPLQWVWEGKDAPDERAEANQGGPRRVLKLLGYQIWAVSLARLGERSADGLAHGKFWRKRH